MIATVAMQYAGYVFGSYALTFSVIGLFSWRLLRKARKLAEQVDDADKYWT